MAGRHRRQQRVRTSVGLIELDPASGAATSYPLAYPDGAHDAETLLIQSDGVPVIVTKDYLGASVVYTTAERQQVQDLSTGSPTMLAKVGQLRFTPHPHTRWARPPTPARWLSPAAP